MAPAAVVLLVFMSAASVVMLGCLALVRVNRGGDLLRPALICAISACGGVWISRSAAPGARGSILFMAGLSAVLALVGLLFSLRSDGRRP